MNRTVNSKSDINDETSRKRNKKINHADIRLIFVHFLG